MPYEAHAVKDIAFRVDCGFAGRLRRVISDSGESMVEFAASIGCDRKTPYYWLNGSGVPNADALHTIGRLYGIDLNWLLMGVSR